MTYVVRGETVSAAWLKAIQYLLMVGGSTYNLVVEVQNPLQEVAGVKSRLDSLLKWRGDQVIETVANTIFPKGLYRIGEARTELYQRYFRVYPAIRKISDNKKGTYFGRMVSWNYVNGTTGENQLEQVIQKLTAVEPKEGTNVVFEVPIYHPGNDANMMMGFPCMSYLCFAGKDGTLNLNAYYRNQYFVKKAYGNYLGLSRLLSFVCSQTGYSVGAVTCTATHATLESGFTAGLRRMVADYRTLFEVETPI